MKPALRQAVDREWSRKTAPPSDEGTERRSAAPATNGDGQSQRRRLSDFLLAEGLITSDQFAQVMAEQKRTNDKLPSVIVRLGFMTEDQMVHAQSRHYRIPFVVLPEGGIPPEILRLVPGAIALKHEVIPIGRSAGALTLAMVDPTNLSAVDDVAFRTGMRVFPVIARPSVIRQALEQFYETQKTRLASALSEAEAENVETTVEANPLDLRASADQAPVVRLRNMIPLEAVAPGGSHRPPGRGQSL